MTKDQIRTIFMQRGFTIKEGQDDLKDYVYEAANDLIRARDEEACALLADGGKGEAVAHPDAEGVCADGTRFSLFECAPREAQNVMNIPLDAAATMADYVPQAECASRAEDPDWMGKLPKCTEWPSGVAPRAEPVEESDVRPKERLCGGSHVACNGVDYCLGHPSCRDIANERAKKEQK